jgi:hypothetical protein
MADLSKTLADDFAAFLHWERGQSPESGWQNCFYGQSLVCQLFGQARGSCLMNKRVQIRRKDLM